MGGKTVALLFWSIYRRDLATGVEDKIIESPSATMRLALSHDGRHRSSMLAAPAHERDCEFAIWRLALIADRWLTMSIDPDSQLGGYYNDLVPHVVFWPGIAKC